LSDICFWLPHDVDEVLVEALVALDASGGRNKKPLIAYLRERTDLGDLGKWLANLLERYNLKRKRGGQETPAYDRTDIHRRMLLAEIAVEGGQTIEKAAADAGLKEEPFRDYLSGHRGSEQRMERRSR
jgi:hypothetical protein